MCISWDSKPGFSSFTLKTMNLARFFLLRSDVTAMPSTGSVSSRRAPQSAEPSLTCASISASRLEWVAVALTRRDNQIGRLRRRRSPSDPSLKLVSSS